MIVTSSEEFTVTFSSRGTWSAYTTTVTAQQIVDVDPSSFEAERSSIVSLIMAGTCSATNTECELTTSSLPASSSGTATSASQLSAPTSMSTSPIDPLQTAPQQPPPTSIATTLSTLHTLTSSTVSPIQILPQVPNLGGPTIWRWNVGFVAFWSVLGTAWLAFIVALFIVAKRVKSKGDREQEQEFVGKAELSRVTAPVESEKIVVGAREGVQSGVARNAGKRGDGICEMG